MEQPVVKPNRFDAIFTAVIFAPARADAKVYTSERKVKSRKMATVRVEVANSGGYLHASVNARQGEGDPKPVAHFSFKGTQFESSFTADDPAIAAELEAWKRSIERKFKLWRVNNPSAAVTVASGESATLDDITL